MTLLQAKALTRIYSLGEERVTGVLDASVTASAGEFVVLAGPSGSGKTTLLNLIGLLDRPTGGELTLEGEATSALSEKERARLRREKLGFVFQTHQLIPVLTAGENVAFPLWLRNLSEEECRKRANASLEAVGLGGMEGRRPDALSGGQRQRVAIARALVNEPVLILADEPTASVDSETAKHLLDLFDEINKRKGVTVIFSSHDPRIIERAARRIDLRDGRVVCDVRRPEA